MKIAPAYGRLGDPRARRLARGGRGVAPARPRRARRVRRRGARGAGAAARPVRQPPPAPGALLRGRPRPAARDRLGRRRRCRSPRSPAGGSCGTCRWRTSPATSTGRSSSTPGSSSGKFPDVLDHPRHGAAARDLFAERDGDARRADRRRDGSRASGVYGLWPANADGDDIVLYPDAGRSRGADALPDAPPAARQGRGQAQLCAGRLRRAASSRACSTTWAPSR